MCVAIIDEISGRYATIGRKSFFLFDFARLDRHWERLGPLDWDDLLVEKFPGIKQKGVFNAVVTEAYDADLTVVYWAKVTSREHVQVYDLAGNFVAENTNGQQDHILKFQLELPSAEERSEPDFVCSILFLVPMAVLNVRLLCRSAGRGGSQTLTILRLIAFT